MKNILPTLLTSVALMITFAVPQQALAAGREHHPEIHEAIHALERAKAHLEAAQHDFGGHRREALEACERAIQQLHLALESDRR